MMRELARLQDALAAVVTGAAYEADATPLAGLSGDDVARYARGLRRKRWQEVARSLPLSARVIVGLEARYDRWLCAHPPVACDGVLPPGLAEASRALADLTRGLGADPGEASWAADLLAFEVAAGCARADGGRRELRARHAVHEIAAELRVGLVPVDPPLAPHAYVFEGSAMRWRRLP